MHSYVVAPMIVMAFIHGSVSFWIVAISIAKISVRNLAMTIKMLSKLYISVLDMDYVSK